MTRIPKRNRRTDYKKNVAIGTGSSPTTLGGSGLAGLSAITLRGDAPELPELDELERDFLVDRFVLGEPLR